MKLPTRVPPLDNPRQEKFCRAYVSGETMGNASASYKVSHPNCKRDGAARTEGWKILTKPNIKKRIRQLHADASLVADIDRQYIMSKLRWEADHAPQAKDRIDALEKLARMNGWIEPQAKSFRVQDGV